MYFKSSERRPPLRSKRRLSMYVVAGLYVLSYAYSVQPYNDSRSLRARGCVAPANACSRVISASCQTGMNPEAFYHRLLDCFVSEYADVRGLLQQNSSVCIVGLGTRCSLYAALQVHRLAFHQLFEGDNYCGAERSTFAYMKASKHELLSVRRKGANMIIRDVFNSTTQKSTRTKVVLVNRATTRNFESSSFARLTDRVRSVLHDVAGEVSFYFGNETDSETISIFSKADAIVMFHGAAAGNIIFTSPGTVLLELTTYTDTNSTKPWRTNSNTMLPVRPDLLWVIHHLNIEDITDEENIQKLNMASDKDRFVKSLKNIFLPDAQLNLIVEKLAYALQNRARRTMNSIN